MALSLKARAVIISGLANRAVGKEVADAIDLGGNVQAASVAAIGATTALVGVDGVGNNAAPLAGTEARLDVVEGKIDAVIAALKAAGLMAV